MAAVAGSVPGAASRLLGAAAVAAGHVLRVSRVPLRRGRQAVAGVAGAAAIALGAGELAGHVFGHGIAPWATLLVAGVFSMWFGAEMNRVPAAARGDG